MQSRYRFHVRGHLDDHWAEWLGGSTIERRDDGSSVLSGLIVDQAALHGIIARIRDLGLPLLTVESVDGACPEIPRSVPPSARGSPTRPDHARASLQRPEHTVLPINDIEGDRPCD